MRNAVWGAVLVGLGLSGCTSVKMVQRDDCWVRRTEKWHGAVQEELGPCARPQQAFVQDRHLRLIQECVAQADYRWQTQAQQAFSRGQPFPEQDSQQQVLELCMAEASKLYVAENDHLRAELVETRGELEDRLAEARAEQEELKASLALNEDHLRSSNDRLAEYLGEAAQKPPGTATATATASSDGTATTENSSKSEESRQESPAATPAITFVTNGGAPASGQQQPQVDQASASRTGAAPENVTAEPRPVVIRKKKVATPSAAPMCTPAEPKPEPGQASAEVAKVVPVEKADQAQELFRMEGPAEQEKLLP